MTHGSVQSTASGSPPGAITPLEVEVLQVAKVTSYGHSESPQLKPPSESYPTGMPGAPNRRPTRSASLWGAPAEAPARAPQPASPSRARRSAPNAFLTAHRPARCVRPASRAQRAPVAQGCGVRDRPVAPTGLPSGSPWAWMPDCCLHRPRRGARLQLIRREGSGRGGAGPHISLG